MNRRQRNGDNFIAPLINNSQPRLSIDLAGQQFILNWPLNSGSYTLQTTTNLQSGIWNPVALSPVIIGTNYYVNTTISGTCRFYRLSQ